MNTNSALLLIILLLSQVISSACLANTFDSWKIDYAKRTSKRGLKKSFILKILSDVELDLEVIKKDRNQLILNKQINYNVFIKKWLRKDNSRIVRGKNLIIQNRKLLNRIERIYGVEKEVIVALWGVETLYGDIMGSYNVIRSLATLAFEGRRRKFYETQLTATLHLIKKGNVSVKSLKGSWAGATGQCQFMPSNIKAYGVDFNNDRKIDLWTTKADVFASIANYLKKSGWIKGKSIGSLAYSSKRFPGSLNKNYTKKQYKKFGYKSSNGVNIINQNWFWRRAALIPMRKSPIILRGTNYLPLLRWNNSSLFAALNIILIDEFRFGKP
jgi:membrane-bound lytic murein transglycosylase B